MKGPRTFVRGTRVLRTKNLTMLEDVVLVHTHVLLYVYDTEKVVHVQKYEANSLVYDRVDTP